MKNIIFIDFLTVFYPTKHKFHSQKSDKTLNFYHFKQHIQNPKADQLAVDYFNKIDKQNIQFVLIDSIISSETVNELKDLMIYNSLDLNLDYDFYFSNKNQSARLNCSKLIEQQKPINYLFIASKELKHNIEFEDTLISFENSIFVDNDNGLSYKNLLEIENSISNWN